MQITVFGASGKVGSLVVEEALHRGYRVIAFVHSHDLFSPNGKLVVVKGDVYKKDDIVRALQGSDAVISCLGSWGTPKKNVLTTAMKTIIPAMHAQHIVRIITLTGSGAKAPDEQVTIANRLVMKLVKPFPAYKVFRDGEVHMKLLASSGLNWTTVRSSVMISGKSNHYALSLRQGSQLAVINRNSVVRALVDQLDSDKFSKQAPFIHR